MRVFVSSTINDLAPYRQASAGVILEMGWQPVLPVEHRRVAGGPAVLRCIEQVRSCQMFILVAGFRCGWIPTLAQGGTGTASITEIELAAWLHHGAAHGGMAPLLFIAEDGRQEIAEGESALHRSVQTVFREKVRNIGNWLHSFALVEQGQAGHGEAVGSFQSLVRGQIANVKAELADAARWQAQQQAEQAMAAAQRARSDGFALALLALGVGYVLAKK
ncbi:MAG: DUF4062 domain-containing protein [Phycisphaerales bacterium]